MIFVTVGTTKFPFDRLLKAVDETMLAWSLKEEIVIQKGTSNYQFNYLNKKVFKEVSFDKMISYFKKARVVVTSGGPASVFLALKYGKNKPLIVPRSGRLGEHVDEHEVLFGKFLKSKKNAIVVLPNGDLIKQVFCYLATPIPNDRNRELVVSPRLIKKFVSLTANYAK